MSEIETASADQHPAADLIAAVLAVTPVGVLAAYEASDRQSIAGRSQIAARQAVAVLRKLADLRSGWGDYAAWDVDELRDLADAIEAAR